MADRLTWVEADAATWAPADGAPQDAVLCIGASHAFGGLDGTLDALRRHLRPGGRALLGETIWEQQPSAAAQEALEARPRGLPDPAQLVPAFEQHGFEVGLRPRQQRRGVGRLRVVVDRLARRVGTA